MCLLWKVEALCNQMCSIIYGRKSPAHRNVDTRYGIHFFQTKCTARVTVANHK